MRKMIILLFAVTLILAFVPVTAQEEVGVSPASLLPPDVPLYIEIDISDEGLEAVQQLTTLLYEVSGSARYAPRPDLVANLDDSLRQEFGADFSLDEFVLSWAGDALGIAAYPSQSEYGSLEYEEYVFVLPIADSDGVASLEELIAGMAEDSVSQEGMRGYLLNGGAFLFTDAAVYLGTEETIDHILQLAGDGLLADTAGFSAVTAALPADATIWGYMSSELPALAFDQMNNPDMMGGISLSTLVEAIFAIHPSISAAEEGLLAAQGLNGLGFAVQVGVNSVDVTGVISVDATYSQPTFTSAYAGDALLQYVPGTSVGVVASYDIVVGVAPVVALAGLMSPTIGNVYDEIVVSLQPGMTLTPLPTRTPLPTPTPPVLSADDIVAQAQPYIDQVELFLGMSLEDLYTLTNGEYAIALVPTGVEGVVDEYGYITYSTSPMGFVAYLQTPDAAALLATVDDLLTNALPTLGGTRLESETETINGIDVTLLGPDYTTRVAYGALNDTTVFVATDDVLDQVFATASGEQPALPDTRLFPAETIAGYGDTALMYYMDLGKYIAQTAYYTDTFMPAVVVTGGLEIGADGLFTGRMTLTFGK